MDQLCFYTALWIAKINGVDYLVAVVGDFVLPVLAYPVSLTCSVLLSAAVLPPCALPPILLPSRSLQNLIPYHAELDTPLPDRPRHSNPTANTPSMIHPRFRRSPDVPTSLQEIRSAAGGAWFVRIRQDHSMLTTEHTRDVCTSWQSTCRKPRQKPDGTPAHADSRPAPTLPVEERAPPPRDNSSSGRSRSATLSKEPLQDADARTPFFFLSSDAPPQVEPIFPSAVMEGRLTTRCPRPDPPHRRSQARTLLRLDEEGPGPVGLV